MIVALGVVLTTSHNVRVVTLIVLARVDRAGVVIKAVGRDLAAAGNVVVHTGARFALLAFENTLIVGASIGITAVGVGDAATLGVGIRATIINARVNRAGLVVVAVAIDVTAARNRLRLAAMSVRIAGVHSAVVVIVTLTVKVATARDVVGHAAITLAIGTSALIVIVGTLTISQAATFDGRKLTKVTHALGQRASIGGMTIGVAETTIGHLVVNTLVLIATIVGARIVIRALEIRNAAVGNHLVLTLAVHTAITRARIVVSALRVASATTAARRTGSGRP